MEPIFRILSDKKLLGKRQVMSLAADRTGELWREFMQERRLITGAKGTDLYSLQVYPPGYFSAFDPATVFEKWAAVEVDDPGVAPAGMEHVFLPGGLYAVFTHKGAAATAPQTFAYIFTLWLPASGYQLDNRPHFEILGEKYRNNDPDSEEEIWIPVSRR